VKLKKKKDLIVINRSLDEILVNWGLLNEHQQFRVLLFP